LLFTTMRTLYDTVGGPGTFLVSATRMGGLHGYDEAGAAAPLGGAVTGFTKTFKREKNDALVKTVDFESSRSTRALADALIDKTLAVDYEPPRATAALADIMIDETLNDPGIVEVGYRGGHRWSIGLEEKPAVDGQSGMALGKDTVFVITGAAGSIVSAITADLAAASGGTFYLLDLAATPDPANSDLQRFVTDKEGLKRDIFERLKARGERATPALVEKEMAGLERSRAALDAIQAVQLAGGTARYYSVNLLHADAVAKVMWDVAEMSGHIDVLLHAAGLEISHLLPDKKPAEFDLVFDVKADGWFNLLSNLGEMPLGAAIVFSSIAGRFGNAGQTDYSSANDLLCKSISSFRSTRPQTRGIAIDWTAWGGIGMAARGSIPVIMKQAGIDMLPPEAGIPTVRRELTAGSTRGEVVVAQGLGIMLKEFDEQGGLRLSEEGKLATMLQNRGIMTGKVTGMGLYSGLTIETTLDPAQQPFLHDHQIGGTPVLPGVMGIEALAETARFLFPDRQVGPIEQVHFLSPFKFYRSQPRTVTLHADFSLEGEDVVAACRLVGSRTLHGQTQAEVTTHFTGRVWLVDKVAPGRKRKKVVPAADGRKVDSGDIYRLYFHGPAYQVLESSWRNGDEVVGLFSANLPANHQPPDWPTLVWPRLIELCFQTAGIWEMAIRSKMGLPYQIDKVCLLRAPDGAQTRLFSVVRPNTDSSFDAQVVDEKGNVYLTLTGYRTMELPDPINASLLRPLQSAIG
jgi:NAD(P)-dependent dehydrogenase (short-subunit alcohol dehydrogenase family)